MVQSANPAPRRTSRADSESDARAIERLRTRRRALIEELLEGIEDPPEDLEAFVAGLVLQGPARAVILRSSHNAMLASRIFSLSYQIRDLTESS